MAGPESFAIHVMEAGESLGDQLFSIKSWMMVILIEGSACLAHGPFV